MKKPLIFSAILAVVISVILSSIPAGAVSSYINIPSPKIGGSWSLSELARDHDGRRVESFKTDRDIVAWTERNDSLGLRYLQVWNGINTTTLATIPVADWTGTDFYDAVEGNYDVADGLVVWTAKDVLDSEIYVYRGNRVVKLTDNSFDDRHPITGGGRIAWTADQGSFYSLMVEKNGDLRFVDTYHVLDYTFSGSSLYWMNVKGTDTQPRVFVDNGSTVRSIGYGEVRPLAYPYFTVDGKGGAAWSRLESYGNLELNVFYVADGTSSRQVLQRERWANEVRVEDLHNGVLLANSHDLKTKNRDDVSLLQANGSWIDTIQVKPGLAHARYMDNGHVRHVLAETSSPLYVAHDDGSESWISETRVEHDVFDADANTAAGAMHDNGGVILYHDRDVTEIDRSFKTRQISVSGDTVVWLEGTTGNSVLVVARPSILVGNSAGSKTVAGRLVKSSVAPTVFLATPGGERYVFPTEGVFYSWYPNFNSLIELPVEELSAMPLSGSVLYPVGSLIKSPSSPKVFAVGANGSISWIADADIIAGHYGTSWGRLVRDLPDSLLAAYRLGPTINNGSNYKLLSVE